jgi:hypothetical protein
LLADGRKLKNSSLGCSLQLQLSSCKLFVFKILQRISLHCSSHQSYNKIRNHPCYFVSNFFHASCSAHKFDHADSKECSFELFSKYSTCKLSASNFLHKNCSARILLHANSSGKIYCISKQASTFIYSCYVFYQAFSKQLSLMQIVHQDAFFMQVVQLCSLLKASCRELVYTKLI